MKKKETREIQYWRISPGQGGYLWREQKLNDCIAIGWSETGSLKKKDENWLKGKLRDMRWPGKRAFEQLSNFRWKVGEGDKVIVCTSGKGIYAIGTIRGDYEYNEALEYSHSRKVQWDTTFWSPVPIDLLRLEKSSFYYKFHGLSSWTIRDLNSDEWNEFCERLNRVSTPFRNLQMWGGLIQAPEYENEVMILFSHMLQHFGMRIIQFGTRFPDAIVERKKGKKWEKLNVEFELRSGSFQDHLPDKPQKCDLIVCWEDNDWGRNNDQKGSYEIIELKKNLENIL